MALSFVKSRGYRHRRLTAKTNAEGTTQPRYLLMVTILLAFLGGFIVGRRESTPTTMSTMLERLSAAIGRDPELSIDQLLGHLTKTRLELEDSFRKDYGDYYGSLYDPFQIQNHVFLASQVSRDRFKRRLMTRILEKLVNPAADIDFVWATAGDSSAAGHGNMFNQSYTAVLERTVQPAFKALGINFVARNYAMSWYQSAPELALCLESVYGTDVDVLNWDFSMQEGEANQAYKIELWTERATQHPNLPILFFVDNRSSKRQALLQQKLEANGVGFLFMDKMAVDLVRSRVPLTADAPATKNWICPDGAVEGSLPCDDPIRFFMCEQRDTAQECLDDKYKVETGCDNGQKSFHPGWKEQQFRGMLMGHLVLDLLEEALIALDSLKRPMSQSSPVRSQIILDRLSRLHLADVVNATKAPVPSSYPGVDEELLRRLTPSAFFRGNSVCHTAMLPAQSRYLGHVTETDQVGSPDGGYDTGKNKVLCVPKNNELPLAYESSDRLRCASPKIDHKDFFYLRTADGWLYTNVPTNAELTAYRRQQLQGIIMICLQLCPMDRCSDDYVGFSEVSRHHGQAKIDIKVDGISVKNVLDLDHRCHVLEGPQGIRWGPGANGDGQYKISMRLHAKLKGLEYSVKISSFVVL